MTSTLDRPDGRTVAQEQRSRVSDLCQPAFLDARLRRHLPAAPPGAAWQTRTIQLDGSGAATVRVALDDGPAVFAKIFPFEDGPEVHAKLQALRAAGLGEGSAEQAVEPLEWFDDVRVLVCREAPGRALSELVGGGTALVQGCARAGRWLGRLHTSGLQVGPPRSLIVTSELVSLAKRLAKSVAKDPGHLPRAVEVLAALDELARGTRDVGVVQSHGQFRPIHVFLTDDVTTVIDLDRTGLADPARDLAEFVHRLRVSAYQLTGTASGTDAACTAFYQAYADLAGEQSLANLRFHRARYIAHSMNRGVKEGKTTGTDDPLLTFYRDEFDRVVSAPGPA